MRMNGQRGFTLVEMIMVIVITGILGSMVAVFIKLPVQQYFDIARRTDLIDIANLALSRMESDLRSALPRSARQTSATCPGGSGTCSFLEFLPSSGSGRYRAEHDGSNTDYCAAEDKLIFTGADTCFEILGSQVTFQASDQVVINNLGTAGADAYEGNTLATHVRRAYAGGVGAVTFVLLTSINQFPSPSPSSRFHVIGQNAVSYVCDPSVGGTLTRYSYAIQAAQPTTAGALGTGSLLAKNVSSCSFDVTQSNSLVAISLSISKKHETLDLSDTVTSYKVVHVSNEP